MESADKIYFYKGLEDVLSKVGKEADKENPTERIRDSFNKVLDGKNLSFLLASGCSSFKEKQSDDFVEMGIPTMLPLATEFYNSENIESPILLHKTDRVWLKKELRIDVRQEKIKSNIELFLGTLFSLKFYIENTNVGPDEETDKKYEMVCTLIKKTHTFLISKCLNEGNRASNGDDNLIELYKNFYKKLLYRNANLPKPNIFTTNYDLYTEIALDKLGIHYVNGFSGGIKKYFNPTIFNYALAEKMDLSQSKWSVIDNFFYLYKIHGSINWIEDNEESKLFKVREIQEATIENLTKQNSVMIYPTPLKQNASMGSPYADLFREFQKKLMQNNNVLVTIGYSFSDEHINNLIYQAFTIPSFRLIVLGDPGTSSEIEKLRSLDDPRIWIIGGELKNGEKLHYFKGFVDNILPDLSNDEIDDKIENAIKTLLKKNEQGR